MKRGSEQRIDAVHLEHVNSRGAEVPSGLHSKTERPLGPCLRPPRDRVRSDLKQAIAWFITNRTLPVKGAKIRGSGSVSPSSWIRPLASVTLVRGCRAKGPGFRDSSRARQLRRAGTTEWEIGNKSNWPTLTDQFSDRLGDWFPRSRSVCIWGSSSRRHRV